MIKNDWLHSINCFSLKTIIGKEIKVHVIGVKVTNNYFTGNEFIDDNDPGFFKYI